MIIHSINHPSPRTTQLDTTRDSSPHWDEDGNYIDKKKPAILRHFSKLPWWMKFWKRENWHIMMLLFAFNCLWISALCFWNGIDDGKNVNRPLVELGWIIFLATGVCLTLAVMFRGMDAIAEDMVENMDPETNCRDMMISTYTNLSLVSALLFTVIIGLLYLDFDFDTCCDDFIANSEIGKDFWKMLVFLEVFFAMSFTVGGTLIAVLLIIYITPLSGDAAIDFMAMNGWSSGLCFELTIGGVCWMFGGVMTINRVKFGAAAGFMSLAVPMVMSFFIGFVWRQASKFEVEDHKRHQSVVAQKEARQLKKQASKIKD